MNKEKVRSRHKEVETHMTVIYLKDENDTYKDKDYVKNTINSVELQVVVIIIKKVRNGKILLEVSANADSKI